MREPDVLAERLGEDVELYALEELACTGFDECSVRVRFTYTLDSGEEISREYPPVKISEQYGAGWLRQYCEDFFTYEAFPAVKERGETPKLKSMNFALIFPGD